MTKTLFTMGLTFLWTPLVVLAIVGGITTAIKYEDHEDWDWFRRVFIVWLLVATPFFFSGLILISVGVANAKL